MVNPFALVKLVGLVVGGVVGVKKVLDARHARRHMNTDQHEKYAESLVEAEDVDDLNVPFKVEIDGATVFQVHETPDAFKGKVVMVETEKVSTTDSAGTTKVTTTARHKRFALPSIWVKSKQQVIAEVGILRDSEANRLVAQRVILDYLKEHKVRPYDIQRIVPVAVELVFVPDHNQILAKRVRVSRAKEQRHDELAHVSQHRPFWKVWDNTPKPSPFDP